MSEMIERVAQAIAERDNHSYGHASEPLRNRWRNLARAAIEAMREPTVDMVSEAHTGVQEISTDALATTWRGMIDRALR